MTCVMTGIILTLTLYPSSIYKNKSSQTNLIVLDFFTGLIKSVLQQTVRTFFLLVELESEIDSLEKELKNQGAGESMFSC